MKNDNTLIGVAVSILIALMFMVMFFQNHAINNLKDIINKTDTITKQDTLYLDKIVKDTVPTVKWKKVIEVDTLWKYNEQDSTIEAQPILVSYQKKK
jgi:low affinity Fe/Cu permease